VKGFGEFAGDSSLTQEEIGRIADWVEGGAPEGDPRHLPSAFPEPVAPAPLPAGTWSRAIKLGKATTLVGIRPVADTPAAKITAHLPDGRIEPLLWLFEYRARFARTFVYRDPVKLPAGTTIDIEPSTEIDLLLGR
jgi:hypothetical protein